MGLISKLTGELIDIIEWTDNTHNTMVWRFQRPDHEIKNGAKLVVREGQAAAFVNEGQLADVFLPGTYTLQTQNLPILSKLKGWKYGFNSPFKAEVYFVSTTVFTDRKWGTKNPIMMRDAEFGPVRLRAFGSFAVRVKYPPVFIRQVVGTNGVFNVEQIEEQLRDLVAARFANALGASKIPVLDLAGNYDSMGSFISERINPEFGEFGLELIKFLIENISLPAEVEAAMDKRSSMGVIGNLQAYTQYSTANAIGDAARNPGGVAGAGIGLGAGLAMGQQMGQAMSNPGAGGGAAATQPAAVSTSDAPPPLPQETSYFIAVGGQQNGPFDRGALRDQVHAGKLTRQTLVWSKGMSSWTAAGWWRV